MQVIHLNCSWKMQLMLLSSFLFFVFVRSSVQSNFHRLQLPSPNSELLIVPRFEIPMNMAPSVQTGMVLRMPISLKFRPASQSTGQREEKSDSNETVKAKSRVEFYRTFEQMSPKFGKACLLRAICEVAQIPLINPSTGIVGEILDLLLTCSNILDVNGLLGEYVKAEVRGRSSEQPCSKMYSGCPFSIFNVVKLSSLFV